jgi:hypothetical protein
VSKDKGLHIVNHGHMHTTDALLDGVLWEGVLRVNLEGFEKVVTATCEIAATCDVYVAYDREAVIAAWHDLQAIRARHDLPVAPVPTQRVPDRFLLLHVVAEGARYAAAALTRAWLPNGQLTKWVYPVSVALERKLGYPRAALRLVTVPPDSVNAPDHPYLLKFLTEYEAELSALLGAFDPADAVDPQNRLLTSP